MHGNEMHFEENLKTFMNGKEINQFPKEEHGITVSYVSSLFLQVNY